MRAALAAALCAGACTGETGVINVSLTTAPGSTLLDGVTTLRLEITNPHQVLTAERTSDGFALAIDLPASDSTGALLVDGLDASGTVVATGASPPFAFSAVTGNVVVYMAVPNSVGDAPVALGTARSELGTGVLPYGAIFAGGQTASGPSDALEIYNAYDHTLVAGLPLPSPRAGLVVASGILGVYMFGGTDDTGTPRDQLWRYDTTVRPSGQFLVIGDKDGFARAHETLVPLGNDAFLMTGDPAAQLDGTAGTVAARSDTETLPRTAATVLATDGVQTAVFVGETSVTRFRNGHFEAAEPAGRAGAAAVALPAGAVALVCGASTDAVRIDAATGAGSTFAAVPSVAKTGCAAAATTRHLLIAGGTTASGVDGAVEVYDATTLAPVTSATLSVPRTGAVAVPLANGQILVAGGVDAEGAPVATLELFTPAR